MLIRHGLVLVAILLLPSTLAKAAVDYFVYADGAPYTFNQESFRINKQMVIDHIENDDWPYQPPDRHIHSHLSDNRTGAYSDSIAISEYGYVGVDATVERPDSWNGVSYANGLAYMKDSLSLFNHVDVPVFFYGYGIYLTIDGSSDIQGAAEVDVAAAARATAPGVLPSETLGIDRVFQEQGSHNYRGSNSLSFSVFSNTGLFGPIVPGDQFITIEFALLVQAWIPPGGSAHAHGGFSNTLKIQNIVFFDENGQVIPGLQLRGSSGIEYPYNVPEPGATTVLACAVILLAGRGCLRFKQR